jgi:hypothetical protein
MKSTKLFNALLLCLGLILLLLPPSIFHWHPDLRTKLAALKYLSVSLIGVALITLALGSAYCARRREQLEDDQA